MKSIIGLGICCVVLAAAGCQDRTQTLGEGHTAESVGYISANEFASTVAEESGVVLVEFCVPAGCFRCDDMRPQIDRLAAEQGGRLAVHRVNLHHERELTSRLGVSVCPSYIAFRDGEEVFRAVYPTSADLVLAGIDEILPPPSAE